MQPKGRLHGNYGNPSGSATALVWHRVTCLMLQRVLHTIIAYACTGVHNNYCILCVLIHTREGLDFFFAVRTSNAYETLFWSMG